MRKTASGRYQARYTDTDGRQKYAPETFPTKQDARAWRSALQTDRNRGNFYDPHAGVERLAEYAETWFRLAW